jgi:poly-gamma-glutamate capsule biosynthesis protein CapA/YwtB (metallophosphatase superfamily)
VYFFLLLFIFSYDYIWGDALDVWEEVRPDLKLINLETSITTHNEPWPGKGINYRMHPKNIQVLTIAGIDHCSLANNHTLDWGRPGLMETMETLDAVKIQFSGVGKNAREARKPSVLTAGPGRVLVYSWGMPTSGIPRKWAAKTGLAGVNLLPALEEKILNREGEKLGTSVLSDDDHALWLKW